MRELVGTVEICRADWCWRRWGRWWWRAGAAAVCFEGDLAAVGTAGSEINVCFALRNKLIV